VPRIWEKFYDAIGAKLGAATGHKKVMADWARGVAKEVTDVKNRGDEPAGLLGLQYRIAQKLVFMR